MNFYFISMLNLKHDHGDVGMGGPAADGEVLELQNCLVQVDRAPGLWCSEVSKIWKLNLLNFFCLITWKWKQYFIFSSLWKFLKWNLLRHIFKIYLLSLFSFYPIISEGKNNVLIGFSLCSFNDKIITQ